MLSVPLYYGVFQILCPIFMLQVKLTLIGFNTITITHILTHYIKNK